MTEAFFQGALTLLQPDAFLMMLIGVAIGTFSAVAPPGLGTPLCYALMIPFAIKMDPVLAIALLLGMDTVTATGNSFLPVLMGVPGGGASQAIILDGYPLGRKGLAKYALGAGFTSSMIGGLFSIGIWLIAIQVFRPLLFYIGSPELFLLVLWGLSMVSVLAGTSPIKGLIALCLGLLLSTVGTEPYTGIDRYIRGNGYFMSGIPISIAALGLFAVPAAFDLVVRKMGVEEKPAPLSGSVWDGAKAAFQHIGLVLRSSVLGVVVGFTPGLGGHVADWLAYGFAAQTCKGARETFGKGDIRGVIAPDSCNSSTDAGALIPVTLLGIPGSVSKALFMSALIMMGLTPGPELINKHLDLVMAMIWVNIYATIIGGFVCLFLIKPLAKLAVLRYTILVPVIVTFGFIGAYSVTRDVFDLALFIAVGLTGVMMKRYGIPRPPVLMGFILGPLLEKYLFISTQRYGLWWLTRPQVMLLLPAILGMLVWTIWSGRRKLAALDVKAEEMVEEMVARNKPEAE